MEMVTDMATEIATGTVTGMVMDVVTETAMEMDVATEVAMEMVTEMAMCLVVEEVEVEEVPQPVEAEAAVLEEVAVAAVVVDMIFASTPRIVQVLIGRLSSSGHVASTRSQHTSSMLYSFNTELCA
jgi:hypothetical protein